MHNLGPQLPDLLGHYGGAFPQHAERASSHDPHLGMPYSSASFSDSPFPHALPGLPHQHLQQQQHQQQQQQGSDHSIRSAFDIIFIAEYSMQKHLTLILVAALPPKVMA